MNRELGLKQSSQSQTSAHVGHQHCRQRPDLLYPSSCSAKLKTALTCSVCTCVCVEQLNQQRWAEEATRDQHTNENNDQQLWQVWSFPLSC